MASTDIAAPAPPFHRAPVSVTIPDLIVIECGYVCLIRRNFSQNLERRPGSGPKFQSVVGAHIDDARFYKSIWMEKPSAIRPISPDGQWRLSWCYYARGRLSDCR